jgi:hypothetical protein
VVQGCVRINLRGGRYPADRVDVRAVRMGLGVSDSLDGAGNNPKLDNSDPGAILTAAVNPEIAAVHPSPPLLLDLPAARVPRQTRPNHRAILINRPQPAPVANNPEFDNLRRLTLPVPLQPLPQAPGNRRVLG